LRGRFFDWRLFAKVFTDGGVIDAEYSADRSPRLPLGFKFLRSCAAFLDRQFHVAAEALLNPWRRGQSKRLWNAECFAERNLSPAAGDDLPECLRVLFGLILRHRCIRPRCASSAVFR